MSAQRTDLPIDSYLDAIIAALEKNRCVIIEASPGTGKTTRVAPALLNSNVLRESRGKVLLLQPRRIAARAAASRIAAESESRVGDWVGYQVRFDSRIGQRTRLIAMTPGILLRRLQEDSALEDVSVVILDEFHERSLETDLLLGMLRRIQTEIRPDLKLVIMSATLDETSIGPYLEDPPLIRARSTVYPVSIRYGRHESGRRLASGRRGGRPDSPVRRIVEQATDTTIQAAREAEGDILVFLPGVGEITRVAQNLSAQAAQNHWELLRLYGDMSPKDQDRVLAPSDRRKVILATNVAETSLTIDGVKIVVDCGWARVQRVDPSAGLNMLRLEPISVASADQRAGRAGRTAPGICYRLWDEVTGRSRASHLEPEIRRIDLAGAALQLLCWGEHDLAEFPWVTPPREAAVAQALELLGLLGAYADGEVTELGRLLAKLPLHPRLGRLLIEGHRQKIPGAAALAAALLSERDVFDRRTERESPSGSIPVAGARHSHPCDLTQRTIAMDKFLRDGNPRTSLGLIKVGAARNVGRVMEQLHRMIVGELGEQADVPLKDQLPQALLAAFPDRLARRRSAGSPRGVMVGGRGVKLEQASGVRQPELFLCLDVDARSGEATVRQASGVEPESLPLELMREADERFINPTQGAVVTRRRTYWLDLKIAETPIATPADAETASLLAEAAASQFERLLPRQDKTLRGWLDRVRWLSAEMPDAGLPTFSRENLAQLIQSWCFGLRRLDELKALPWRNLLEGLLDTQARRLLRKEAPDSFTFPSGRTAMLQYEMGKPPILAARIQDFFGIADTPRIAGGRVPLILHLLAPNQRCQQITDDLASFWANTYPVVRKELRGRYPKHAWPENPLVAN